MFSQWLCFVAWQRQPVWLALQHVGPHVPVQICLPGWSSLPVMMASYACSMEHKLPLSNSSDQLMSPTHGPMLDYVLSTIIGRVAAGPVSRWYPGRPG